MKINVIIPTLYGHRSTSYLEQVTKLLLAQLDLSGVDYSVTTIGRKNIPYDNFSNPKINKLYVSGLESIHMIRQFNAIIKDMPEEDIFCLFHDDLFIDFNYWPKMYLDAYNTTDLKCGVLGCVSHSQSIMGYVGHNLFRAGYANGNFFVKAKYIKMGFDENLAEECGDIDLCNEQMINGRNNYLVAIPHRHYMMPSSITFSYLKDFKQEFNKCRKYLNEKWLKRNPKGVWE